VLFNTPPGAEIDPFPSFNPPFHTALAFRSMLSPHHECKVTTFILDGVDKACQCESISRGNQ
jgi:hypothetical protein